MVQNLDFCGSCFLFHLWNWVFWTNIESNVAVRLQFEELAVKKYLCFFLRCVHLFVKNKQTLIYVKVFFFYILKTRYNSVWERVKALWPHTWRDGNSCGKLWMTLWMCYFMTVIIYDCINSWYFFLLLTAPWQGPGNQRSTRNCRWMIPERSQVTTLWLSRQGPGNQRSTRNSPREKSRNETATVMQERQLTGFTGPGR